MRSRDSYVLPPSPAGDSAVTTPESQNLFQSNAASLSNFKDELTLPSYDRDRAADCLCAVVARDTQREDECIVGSILDYLTGTDDPSRFIRRSVT